MSRKAYVWDESVYENVIRESSEVDVEKKTYDNKKSSNPTFESMDYFLDKQISAVTADEKIKSTMQTQETLVTTLEEKIQAMRIELNQKNSEISALMKDYRNIQKKQEDRRERLESMWLSRILSAKEQGTSALLKQRELSDRLMSNIENLQLKIDSLQLKLSSIDSNFEENVRLARDELTNQQQRQRRQLVSDEKLTHDKAMGKKEDAMKKQAAVSFGPVIDEMVIKNKETLQQLRDDIESRLEDLKLVLASDAERILIEKTNALKDKFIEEEKISVNYFEKQLNDIKVKQDFELERLKQKFIEDAKQSEEKWSSIMKAESDKLTENFKIIQDTEYRQSQELTSKHQQALLELRRHVDEEIKAFRRHVDTEKSDYAKHCDERFQRLLQERKRRDADIRSKKIDQETALTIEKVRQDILVDRRNIQTSIESQANEAYQRVNSKILELRRSLEESLNHYNDLKIENKLKESSTFETEKEIRNAKLSILELNKALNDFQQELVSLELESYQKSGDSATLESQSTLLNKWRNNCVDISDQLESFKAFIGSDIESKRSEHTNRLQKIREKISKLLTSKSDSLVHLEDQLSEIIKERKRLESILDKYRECHSSFDVDNHRVVSSGRAEGNRITRNKKG